MKNQWVTNAGRMAITVALIAIPLSACHAGNGAAELQQGAAAGDGAASAGNQEGSKLIKDGSKVSVEYTLKLSDGSLVDSNTGKDPLVYTQGGSQILPALEKQLVGLKVGDTKSVKLSAAEGYGEIDPKAFREVDIAQIPEEARKVGALLVAAGADGNKRPIRVHEVRDDKVVLDFNHPLAGKDLVFDITIVGVE